MVLPTIKRNRLDIIRYLIKRKLSFANLCVLVSPSFPISQSLNLSFSFFLPVPLSRVGGGNAAGQFTATNLQAATTVNSTNAIKAAGYGGVMFDAEEVIGDAASVVGAFKAAFAACKSAGLKVGVTTSHSAPYATDTPEVAVALVKAWAGTFPFKYLIKRNLSFANLCDLVSPSLPCFNLSISLSLYLIYLTHPSPRPPARAWPLACMA